MRYKKIRVQVHAERIPCERNAGIRPVSRLKGSPGGVAFGGEQANVPPPRLRSDPRFSSLSESRERRKNIVGCK